MTKDLFCCGSNFHRPNQLNNHYRQIHGDLAPTDPATWPDIIIRDVVRHKQLGTGTWLRYVPFPRSSKSLTWTVAAPLRSVGTREERIQRRSEAKRSDRLYKRQISILKSQLEDVQQHQNSTEHSDQSLHHELSKAYSIAAEYQQNAAIQAHVVEELSHVKRLLKASQDCVNELRSEIDELQEEVESLHSQLMQKK